MADDDDDGLRGRATAAAAVRGGAWAVSRNVGTGCRGRGSDRLGGENLARILTQALHT